MKKLVTKSLGAALLSACVGTVTAAPIPADDVSALFGTDLQNPNVAPLSQVTMQETKGEFLQLMGFVLAVAAVDLAITAVVWGSFSEVAEVEGKVKQDDVIIQDSAGAEKISGTSRPSAPTTDVTKTHDNYTNPIEDMKSCDTFCVETHGI
ncbi:hypothetical protein [Aequoribacter sp.]|uniref:hypothetical protein n=1 Tax=Aequoribacter sp. TaxID=2847771 RepID=UPI003C340F13